MSKVEFKYHNISKNIIKYIHDQNLFPGTKLPSIRSFANQFNTSKNTVIRALELLEDERVITTKRNLGFFVSEESWVSANRTSIWKRYDKASQNITNEKVTRKRSSCISI